MHRYRLSASRGRYIVELRGSHGEITGDQQYWFHAGRRERNPRILANSETKRLASVLKDIAYRNNVPAHSGLLHE